MGKKGGAKLIWLVLDSLREDTFSSYNGGVLGRLKKDSVYFPSTIAQSTFTPVSFGSFLTGMNPYSMGTSLVTIDKKALMDKKWRKKKSGSGDYVKGVKLNELKHKTVFDHFKNPISFTRKILGKGYDYGPWNLQKESKAVNAAEFIRKSGGEFLVFVRTAKTHIPWKKSLGRITSMPIMGKDYEYFQGLKRLHRFYSNRLTRCPAKKLIMLSAYLGLDSFVRNELAGMIRALKEKGIYDETCIIITADHSDNLHENYKEGFEHIAHGFDVNDRVINVPLLIKLPGNAHGGEMVRDVVRNIDILPTLLALYGKEGSEVDGVPLIDNDGNLRTGLNLTAYSEAFQMFCLKKGGAKLTLDLTGGKKEFSYRKCPKGGTLKKEADSIIKRIFKERADEDYMVSQLKKLGYF